MRGVLKEKGDQLTKILADPDKGSLRLASIKALSAQGRSSEAIALVEDVTDHRERIDADLGLARCLAAASLIDLAAEATNDAKNRISQIEDAEDKLSALAAMIEASVEGRSVEDIETYAGQFLGGIAQIEDVAKRDPRLRKVGRIMLAGGELRWAQRFFEELTGDTKFDCLLELLPQLLEAAEMQAAVAVLNQCLLLTATRSTPAETAEARVRILVAGADRGGAALAAGLVNIVHSLVQDIGDPETRARLLTKVIAPSAHLLPQQAVLRIARDVESTADEIPQQDPKASVLTDLTNALLDAGLHMRARQAATLAESAGQVDPSSDVRIDDVKDLVKVLLGLGDAHRAAQVAGQIADPGERQRMLSKIAAWQAVGNPGRRSASRPGEPGPLPAGGWPPRRSPGLCQRPARCEMPGG